MRDKDKGDSQAALQSPQFSLHLHSQLMVKGRERLIQQQHFRTIDDRASNCNPLPLTTRHFRDFTLAIAVQLHHMQSILYPLGNLFFGDSLDF